MQWLSSVLLAIQVISSLSIIVLVLLQQGKGADMGSSFGGGSAGSLFGASGAANFLSRTTKWAAIIFFVSTGGLAWVAHHPTDRNKVHEGVMQGFESTPAPAPVTGSDVPSVPGSSQGTAVPPAQSSTPQPASSQPAAVPSAPAASPDAAAVPAAPAAEPSPAKSDSAPAPAPAQ